MSLQTAVDLTEAVHLFHWEKLNAEAAKLGKSIQIDFQANAEAFQAMKAVQMERHDAIYGS